MFGNIFRRLFMVLFFFLAISLSAQELDEANPPPVQEKGKLQAPPEPSPEEKADQNKNDVNKYSIELGEEGAKANNFVKEAREAFLQDKFKESVDKYLEAKKIFQSLNGFKNQLQPKITAIDEAVSVVYYYWSLSLAKTAEEVANLKNYDEAISHCEEAKKICPSSIDKMDDLIERFKKMKETVKYREETNKTYLLPNGEQKEYNLDVLFEQGKRYLEDGQYDKARDKFEQLLTMNPYHVKAIMYVRFIYDKLYKAGTDRMELTIKERLTESEWKYVSPLLPRAFTGEKENLEAPIEKREALSTIDKKLASIVIDHIEFEETSIPQVISELRNKSKECDPDGQGVNIFLRLGGQKAATEGATKKKPTPEAAEGEGGEDNLDSAIESTDINTGADQVINLIADEIPLREAIQNLCTIANLKWRVEKYAVVIASQEVPLDNLETRIYPLDSPDKLGEEGGGGGGGGAGAAADKEGGTKNCEAYFHQRGIQFPEGAKVVYDSRINRIIATNTPDNLQKIERVIAAMNVTEPQVLIEAKFVEVDQNDLNELGFEWLVSKPATLTNLNRDRYGQPTSTTFNQNDPLMRYADTVSPTWTNGGDIVANITHHADNGITYQAIVHALEVSSATDILSTPRVTVKSGEEATIRMITDIYLPESWSPASYLPAGTATQVIDIFIPSVPQLGEPTEMGVTMRVTPTVDADAYTIALDLLPMTQELVGWIDYSYQVPSPTGQSYTNVVRMPIIERRTVQTPMQIYDGETVVMGGINRDANGTIDDQIPVLGEIPIIGRLFQSQVENNTKRNLLIFTTVRLVQPDGSPYRAREIPGLPPFTQ